MLKEVKTKNEHYFVDTLDRIQGEYKRVNESGQLCKQCFYVDDKVHGEFTLWDSDGLIWKQCCFINGRVRGECRVWKYLIGEYDCYFFVDGNRVSFDEIPLPTTMEELMLFKLKYDLQLLSDTIAACAIIAAS